MELPSLESIAHKAKRAKRERESAFSCYEGLVAVESTEQLEKLPKEARECWLVAKFGIQCVVEAQTLLQAIPKALTDSQRKEVLHDFAASATASECVSEVAAIMCTGAGFEHLLDTTSREQGSSVRLTYQPILAPPTRHCYECSSLLVSNHKTEVSCPG